MRPWLRGSRDFLILLGLLAIFAYPSIRSNHRTPKDHVLPNDDFDKATMEQIQSCLNQYHVAENPQDHEVYMVTGGLGVANPRIMSWDSAGNMDFTDTDGKLPIYHFTQTSQSPATWYMKDEGKGVMWTNGPEDGFQPVPWELRHTASGFPYYEWDMSSTGTKQFYFQKDNTYIVLKADYMGTSKPTFPEQLPSHLVPVGNPVN